MAEHITQNDVYSESDINAILRELNADVSGDESLRSWSVRPGIVWEKVDAGAVNAVTLRGRDEQGDTVVLQLDDEWHRVR
jgi:hypothetical protein